VRFSIAYIYIYHNAISILWHWIFCIIITHIHKYSNNNILKTLYKNVLPVNIGHPVKVDIVQYRPGNRLCYRYDEKTSTTKDKSKFINSRANFISILYKTAFLVIELMGLRRFCILFGW
jgi:hypothetical protein